MPSAEMTPYNATRQELFPTSPFLDNFQFADNAALVTDPFVAHSLVPFTKSRSARKPI